MSNLEILLIVGGVSIGIAGALFFLLPYLKKIGVNVEDLIKKVETALKGADEIVSVAKEVEPTNKGIDILKVTIEEALKGVNRAEQLYISSQIPADQRKQKAIELITAALKVAGINITSDLETVIDGYIDDVIYASKTPEEIKAQAQNTLQVQNTQLQATIAQLLAEKTTLQQQVTDLTTKITTVQATVTTAGTSVAQA